MFLSELLTSFLPAQLIIVMIIIAGGFITRIGVIPSELLLSALRIRTTQIQGFNPFLAFWRNTFGHFLSLRLRPLSTTDRVLPQALRSNPGYPFKHLLRAWLLALGAVPLLLVHAGPILTGVLGGGDLGDNALRIAVAVSQAVFIAAAFYAISVFNLSTPVWLRRRGRSVETAPLNAYDELTLEVSGILCRLLLPVAAPVSEWPTPHLSHSPQTPQAVREVLDAENAAAALARRVEHTRTHIIKVGLPSEIHGEPPANTSNGFYVDIRTPSGYTDDAVLRLVGEPLVSELKMNSFNPLDLDGRKGVVRLRIYAVKPKSLINRMLEKPALNKAWLQDHRIYDLPSEEERVKALFDIPLAETVDGEVWNFETFHSAVVGRSGSGKGSIIQSLIWQLAPFTKDGLVRLYFIDPKNAEAIGYADTTIFEQVASSTDDILPLLDDFHIKMGEKIKTAGRSNPITREAPLDILIIDEFPSLVSNRDVWDSRNPSTQFNAQKYLNDITRQGRSVNSILLIASQGFLVDEVGNIRKLLGTKIALANDSRYELGNLLGEDKGVVVSEPDNLIPLSNKKSGYRSAGIAWVQDDQQQLQLVRFPYISDSDIKELQSQYRKSLDSSAEVDQPSLAFDSEVQHSDDEPLLSV